MKKQLKTVIFIGGPAAGRVETLKSGTPSIIKLPVLEQLEFKEIEYSVEKITDHNGTIRWVAVVNGLDSPLDRLLEIYVEHHQAT